MYAVRNGEDNEALTHLYKSLYPKIKWYIIKNSGSEEDAEDVFQNAIMIFYAHVKQNKFKDEHRIDGFVYTVSKNLWINRAKQKQKFRTLSDLDYDISAEDEILSDIISKESEKLIKQLFAELGEVCGELLSHAVFYKLSAREIAEKMGYSGEDAVRTKKYKCKKRLLKLMEEMPRLIKELTDD